MSALGKRFPNATALAGSRVVFKSKQYTENGTEYVVVPLEDWKMANHAVNTYDARDEALREADRALKNIGHEPERCPVWSWIHGHGEEPSQPPPPQPDCVCGRDSALAKIEAALAEGTK